MKSAYGANPKVDPGDPISDAIRYAVTSIPETLAKLTPTQETLVSIARAKHMPLILGRKFGK